MKNLIILSLIALFSLTKSNGQSNSTALVQKHFNLEKGLALEGYDAVSYFQNSKPAKGKSNIQATSNGATYYFSNSANRDLFIKEPERYKPQYGGWCAYAMGATGEKVEVDINTFKIINGKLYLFYNAFFNNTLTTWNKREVELKSNADMNWKRICQ